MGFYRNERIRAIAAGLTLTLGIALWGCGTQSEVGAAPTTIAAPTTPTTQTTQTTQSSETTATTQPATAVSDADLNQLVAGNTAFAVDLFQAARDATPHNLILSPYSVSCALVMASAGAAGDTLEQIRTALHISLPADALHPAFNRLATELAQRPEQARATRGPDAGKDVLALETAQGLFGSPDEPWRQQFLDLLAANYGAGMQTVNFHKSEEARALINHWVSDRTNNLIPEALPPGSINPNGLPTELVLANALYLRGSWLYPFPGSAPQDFHLLDGSSVSVDTMEQSMPFPAAQGDGWRALELPYKGEKLSFVVILPDEAQFQTFAAGLTAEKLAPILAAVDADREDPDELIVRLPKFTFKSSVRLKEALQALGVKLAFEEAADFSPTGAAPLWIDEVYHGATIAVDEQGTEASAATEVVMVAGITDKTMIVDRPFLFLIRDRDTGTVLFLGQVVDPRPQG
jgi:serpin B